MSLLPDFDKQLVKKARVSGKIKDHLSAQKKKKQADTGWKAKPKGCKHCPLNEVEGICKIKGLSRIRGEKIFLWGMSPYKQENSQGLELVGPSGQFLWKELGAVGITRDDCDIQNLVRCMTTKEDEEGRIVPREPTKEETYFCSKYTERALQKSKALVHIVLGNYAARTLLGSEYKKTRTVFWSDKLQAKVICLYHPSYFLRSGYGKSKIDIFRDGLRSAKEIVSGKGARYEVLEGMNFKGITKPEKAREFLAKVKEKCHGTGERLILDIEEGWVEGRQRILCIGMSFKEGYARTLYVDHPEDRLKRAGREEMLSEITPVLTDPKIKKGMHHGCYDGTRMKELWDIAVRGYDYDTLLAEYLVWSERKSYALGEIAETRLPTFAGYKDIIKPYIEKPDPNTGRGNYANIPKEVMDLYNGGDCHVAKFIERTTKNKVPLGLLKVYTLVSFTLMDMETRGPILDPKHFKIVVNTIPKQANAIEQKIQRMVNDPGFNPRSPQQVHYAMYTMFKMPARKIDNRTGKPLYTTDATALELLAPDYEFARLMILYRTFARMGTYMQGYKRSAEAHDGELRTKWWLTGASTGRMSSGGGEDTVNFQNLHGNPLMKNLLVSDLRWRKLMRKYEEIQSAS